MVPGPDCMEDGRMCPNGIHHASRSVSAWRYVGVHCHGSEQCHVRVASAAVLNSLTKTHLAGKRHADDDDLQHAVVDWLNSQAAVWYEERISKLVSRYKCLSVQGDYVEK